MKTTIEPEILNDEFHSALENYAAKDDVNTILEIGSSSGAGSTNALVSGILRKTDYSQSRLFCMEASRPRYKALAAHYANHDFVRCYNLSSVASSEFPAPQEVVSFYNTIRTNLNLASVDTVLGWLEADLEYIKDSGCDINGINVIKEANQIVHFDMALIDGSEFTGERELFHVMGAGYIALDDVNAFKCWNAYQILLHTSRYELMEHNFSLRNGFAIFKRRF